MEPEEVAPLVEAAASGDAPAWARLIERFSGLVWAVARSYHAPDAADVFQTTWLRLAENLGRIQNPERIGAWLATTARREAIRVARSSANVMPVEDLSTLVPADDASPEGVVLEKEKVAMENRRAQEVWRAFSEMPARCQALLRLLMASPPPSYADVAAALEMPIGSVGPTRGRCLRALREDLNRRGINGRLTCS